MRLHLYDYTCTITLARLHLYDYTCAITLVRLHLCDCACTIALARLHLYDYTCAITLVRLHLGDYTLAFALKEIDFALKEIDFALKESDFALKESTFALPVDRPPSEHPPSGGTRRRQARAVTSQRTSSNARQTSDFRAKVGVVHGGDLGFPHKNCASRGDLRPKTMNRPLFLRLQDTPRFVGHFADFRTTPGPIIALRTRFTPNLGPSETHEVPQEYSFFRVRVNFR